MAETTPGSQPCALNHVLLAALSVLGPWIAALWLSAAATSACMQQVNGGRGLSCPCPNGLLKLHMGRALMHDTSVAEAGVSTMCRRQARCPWPGSSFAEATVSLAACRCLALLAARACQCRLPMAPPAWPWQHPTPSLRCQVRSVPVADRLLSVDVLAYHLRAELQPAVCNTCQVPLRRLHHVCSVGLAWSPTQVSCWVTAVLPERSQECLQACTCGL